MMRSSWEDIQSRTCQFFFCSTLLAFLCFIFDTVDSLTYLHCSYLHSMKKTTFLYFLTKKNNYLYLFQIFYILKNPQHLVTYICYFWERSGPGFYKQLFSIFGYSEKRFCNQLFINFFINYLVDEHHKLNFFPHHSRFLRQMTAI